MDAYGYPKIVGFIDDSLVIVADERSWRQRFSDGTDIVGLGRQRLRVFNYRVQEEGPRWMDTLDNFVEKFNYVMGQLSDSVVWGAHGNELLSFWKLGEKQNVKNISVRMEGCDQKFSIQHMRTWINSTIFALNEKSLKFGENVCQYAILDTNARMLTFKRLSKELEWLKNCNDVRAWGDSVYCLALKDDPMNLYLVKNGAYLDTLLQNNPYGWASYTKVGFSGNMLNLGNNVCKIVDDKISCLGVSIRSALEYRIEDGFTVIY